MSCLHVHDFINGTMIAMPRATAGQQTERDVWDILRPNRKAAVLVARHAEALEALSIKRTPEAVPQELPLWSASSSTAGI